jgi:hypothetical protein
MSMLPSSNPNTTGFRSYSPGPHAGVDPDAEVAPSAMDSGARNALTLGLLSLVLSVLTGIPAIWYGRKSLRHIAASDGALEGRWAAWTGIALGILSVVVLVAGWTYLHQKA